MSGNKKKLNIKKTIPLILSLIFILVVVISFLISFIGLVLKPSAVFAVEERQNISRRNNSPDIL